jgi:hypothetical protein
MPFDLLPDAIAVRGHRTSNLISRAEIAAALGCHRRTLRRWESAGRLVPTRVGHSVFYSLDQVRRLIAADMVSGGFAGPEGDRCTKTDHVSNVPGLTEQ